jgi:hypothetical protein
MLRVCDFSVADLLSSELNLKSAIILSPETDPLLLDTDLIQKTENIEECDTDPRFPDSKIFWCGCRVP